MKRFFYVFVLVMFSASVFGQNPLSVGKNQLNLGVGLSDWGIPVYLGFDYGVHKDITLGGELSFRNYHDKSDYNHSIIGISGNGNYHFNHILSIPRNWDLYAGLNLGFYYWNSPNGYNGSYSSGLGLGAQVGGRYCISKTVALNLEFGGGNAFSGGKFGLTIKL